MNLKILFMTALLTLTSTVALGSGSSGGGEYGATSNYDIGKKVFLRKLHCDSCPLGGVELDSKAAAEILPSLKSDGEYAQLLTPRERRMVTHFLKRRFKI